MKVGMDPPRKKLKLALYAIGQEIFFNQNDQFNCIPTILALSCLNTFTTSIDLSPYCLLFSDEHFKCKFYYESWIPRYIEYDFYALFRMKRRTFHSLLSEIGRDLVSKKFIGGNFPVPLEKSLLICISYLARKETMLSIGDRFNVASSTVYNSITDIINVLSDSILKKYIVWPSVSKSFTIERRFRRISGFPGVLGAIDGCHIKAKVPVQQHDSYQNRKMQHSISIQGICSSDKLFLNIASGYPGSIHDARILKESTLYRNIRYSGEDRYFMGKYHLVGDSAYPCKNWLMPPFRDTGHLHQEENHYNKLLSKTRVAIENAFALLKGRWRILKDLDTYTIERAVKIINSCCTLHNFCLLESDSFELEERHEAVVTVNNAIEGDDILGVNKRRQIRDYLWQKRF